jgi:hypothetical protein
MLINQLTWRGIPIWPPLWSEENYTVSERGLLKNVELLPINRLIRIEATCAGASISGLILANDAYQSSLYRKLKENIGKPLGEVGKMQIELSGHPDSGSLAGRYDKACHGLFRI